MKRIVTFFVFCVSTTLFAQHRSVIDQEQPAINNTVGGIAIGGPSTEKLAQTFTAAQSGFLTTVTMPISCDASALLTVSLNDVTPSGEPGTHVIASETIGGSVYPPYISPYSVFPAAGMRLVEFNPSPKVKAGVQYAIILTAVGECASLQSLDGNLYSAGHGYFDALPNPPGWVAFSATQTYDDMAFQTFVRR